MRAHELLQNALDTLAQRAADYDTPTGESTVYAAVDAFNALTGKDLAHHEGALFMALVKAGRAAQSPQNPDHYVDGAAYFGLAGQAAVPAPSTAEEPHATPQEPPVYASIQLQFLHDYSEAVAEISRDQRSAFDSMWEQYRRNPNLRPTAAGGPGHYIQVRSGNTSVKRTDNSGLLNRLFPTYRTAEQAWQAVHDFGGREAIADFARTVHGGKDTTDLWYVKISGDNTWSIAQSTFSTHSRMLPYFQDAADAEAYAQLHSPQFAAIREFFRG